MSLPPFAKLKGFAKLSSHQEIITWTSDHCPCRAWDKDKIQAIFSPPHLHTSQLMLRLPPSPPALLPSKTEKQGPGRVRAQTRSITVLQERRGTFKLRDISNRSTEDFSETGFKLASSSLFQSHRRARCGGGLQGCFQTNWIRGLPNPALSEVSE